MKLNKKILIPFLSLLIASFALTGCKVGDDDPLVALKSRTERFSQNWELENYRINGASQDLSNSSLTWEAENTGVFQETIQGELFGFQTVETNEGSWRFLSNEEQVRIAYEDETQTYILDRLSKNDLWVRMIDGDDVYEFIFERK